MCRVSLLCLAAAMSSVPVAAQIAEPILTKSALPFQTGSGSLKLDYAGGIGDSSGNAQIIPQATMEVGVHNRLEALVKFPLLRVTWPPQGNVVIAGGQTTMGARYLLLGGASQSYAISVQGVLEIATGDKQVVGDATHLTPTLLTEWHPIKPVVIRSNLVFDHAMGGLQAHANFFEYDHAVGWFLTSRFVPQFEVAGSTNLTSGRNQLVGQPEIVFLGGSQVELKAGLAIGLNSSAPDLGLRIQLPHGY